MGILGVICGGMLRRDRFLLLVVEDKEVGGGATQTLLTHMRGLTQSVLMVQGLSNLDLQTKPLVLGTAVQIWPGSHWELTLHFVLRVGISERLRAKNDSKATIMMRTIIIIVTAYTSKDTILGRLQNAKSVRHQTYTITDGP